MCAKTGNQTFAAEASSVRKLASGAARRGRQRPSKDTPGLASSTALFPSRSPAEQANQPVTGRLAAGPAPQRTSARPRGPRISGDVRPGRPITASQPRPHPLRPRFLLRRFAWRRAFQWRMWRLVSPLARQLTADPRPWFPADFFDPRDLAPPLAGAPSLRTLARLVFPTARSCRAARCEPGTLACACSSRPCMA